MKLTIAPEATEQLAKLPKAIQKKANRQFITLLTKLPPSLTKNQKNG